MSYKFEIYYEGCLLHEEEGFYTYEEAQEEAEMYIASIIEDWELDDVLYDYEEFGIVVS